MKKVKIISGIPILDDVMEEIPAGKVLTYWIDPEVEGEVFGMQTLYTNLEKGYKCAYVTITLSPSAVESEFLEFGWEIDRENFTLVDLYSEYVGMTSECQVSANPLNYGDVKETINKIIQSNDLVVIPFSSMVDVCGSDVLDMFDEWLNIANESGTRIIINFISWPYPDEIKKTVKEKSNAIVGVGGLHHRVVLGYYYGVVKVDWKNVKGKAILFKLVRPGGVRAYIPKILVTGPFNAGKSTFVHAVSNKAISVDRLGTTVALDHGHVEYRGFTIDLFGTPGQERFDPILRMLGKEALGVILVVDSTKPETFPRAKQMLESVTHFGLPYVVVANKQDLPNALPPEVIREKMFLPDDVPVIPVSALNGRGIYEVLDSLINLLTCKWQEEEGNEFKIPT